MEYYIVKESDLLNLLNDQRELRALEVTGVDNWDGMEYVSNFILPEITNRDLPAMYNKLCPDHKDLPTIKFINKE
jgi:hypothetical protein